ncbi:hypothetical protein MGYG_06795 [Nannizzia gypsea CBS 118893]|uniref:Uncharacterized protein n=1 Tax=Arthroderma gypseum (strain ATCC MYA-4604 / CBS 118893) TaxID=535722 RepID=E4V181_ARTGP|nr:hypothetical protein MGYG_06795 [Nannizzia gypsea CBS 118893]EFR03796.1 hypothetical protein MGYG_06795 [Nannizzia gypsea CBS 118893]
MFTYIRRDDQRPSSVACAPPPAASSQPPPRPSSDSFTASNSALTDGIFESGIWTAEPDLNSAFNSGKWFSDEKICCCPGKTVPPSPEEKIVVTEYELRDNWLANDRYHSNVSSMYGSTQNSPGVGVGAGAGFQQHQQLNSQNQNQNQGQNYQAAGPENTARSSSTWRWTLGKGSGSSPSDSLKGGGMGEGGYSPGAVASRSSSKPSPDTTTSSSYAAESRGFLRESGNALSKKHQQNQHQSQHQHQQHHHGQEVVEVPSSKGTKTRLNLLNPMALLARRRSAQLSSSRPEDISISKLTVPALPDDYDPRIRGSLVHDFSVPRARSNMVDSSNARSRQVRELPDNPPRPQMPQQQAQQTQVMASMPYRQMNRASVELPPKPQAEIQHYSLPPTPKPEADRQQQQQQHQRQNSQDASSTHTRSPPSTMRYKPGSVRDPSFVPLGLPRHLTSSASRFSFDMAGAASSSQEKLMEERHKEKEAAKRAMGASSRRSEFDEDSDEFDYDAMMDDDGLEEKIPGVNADADSIDEYETGASSAMQNYMKSYAPTLSTVMSSPTSPPGNSAYVPMANTGVSMPPGFIMSSNQPGLSMYTGFQPVPAAAVSPELPTTAQGASRGNGEDDLYYDDGLFGELPPEMQGSTIDESIFDDESSYLYDNKRRAAQPPPQAPSEESTMTSGASHGHPMPQNSVMAAGPAHTMDKPPSQSQGLTKGNLEAYHSALAQAANEAARKGRFERNASLSETSLPEGESQTDPCLTTDDSRMSQTVDTDALGMDDSLDDFDYYDGDGLDDDPIIAEANADVLEHDDEGFYGREFGFYAHAHGSDDKERVYGGYFGAPGAEGIIRNHSGRKNFREPSLTPITERSEWSTRNSIVSLGAHVGHSCQQQQQPPLAQLVDMEVPEDEISLSALMKLRRGAWGGSNGSLRSNTGGSQGAASPSATQPNRGSLNHYYDTGSPVQGSGLMNYGGGSELNSPIHADKEFTQDPRSIRRYSDSVRPSSSWDPNRHSLRMEDEKPSNVSTNAGERISYVRGTDESGSQYWVLERRRTGDGGESEVLERETMKLRI